MERYPSPLPDPNTEALFEPTLFSYDLSAPFCLWWLIFMSDLLG